MKKATLKAILYIVLSMLSCHVMTAQVTIGALLPANKGALLDLKEDNNLGINSQKGLLLPRVALTSKTALYPMFTTPTEATDPTNMATHTGLTVYNVGNNPLCPGIYIWNGTIWEPIVERCVPFINIEDPTNKIVDFGTTATAQTVTFSTNSDWLFTFLNTPDQSNTVIKLTSKNVGTTYTGGTIANVVTDNVIFDPETRDIDPAGTVLTTDVQFETTGNTGQKEDTKIVTFKRTVPSKFSISNLSKMSGSQILATGENITFDVTTNDAFDIFSSLSASAVYSKAKATLQTYSVTVNIPAYTGSRGSQRSVDIHYMLNGTKVKIGTYVQVLPIIDIINPSGKIIDFGTSSAAQTVTLSTNSSWAFTYINSPVPSSDVITASSHTASTTYTGGTPTTNATPSLTFTPNTSNTDAAGTSYTTTIRFETRTYLGFDDSTILTLRRTVPSVFNVNSLSKASGSEIFADGENITFNVETNDAFEITSSLSATAVMTKAKASKQTYPVTVAIPAYTGAAGTQRTVTISYTLNGTTTVIASYIQKAPWVKVISTDLKNQLIYHQHAQYGTNPWFYKPSVTIDSNLGKDKYKLVVTSYYLSGSSWIQFAQQDAFAVIPITTKTSQITQMPYQMNGTYQTTKYVVTLKTNSGLTLTVGNVRLSSYYTMPNDPYTLVDAPTYWSGRSQAQAVSDCQAKGWRLIDYEIYSFVGAANIQAKNVWAFTGNYWWTAIQEWGTSYYMMEANDINTAGVMVAKDGSLHLTGTARCVRSNNLSIPN